MKYLLALDQSTSATKAVLFDEKARLLDKATREHRQIYPQPGWVEHDAEAIWQNALEVIGEIVGRNSSKLRNLAGISIANQRETVVAFNRKTGRPLHNAIVWQCRRGSVFCDKLRKRGKEDPVLAKTGLRIDPYFSASKMKWLMESVPSLTAKIRKGTAVFGTMDSYLIHRLTQGRVFATDSTNASRTLLYNIISQEWDEVLCRIFSVPLQALPEVRESASEFGTTDANGLLPHAIPIIGVMGDSQASLFAQRCFKSGTAKATFGTGTSILLNTGSRFHPPQQGMVCALAWVLKERPVYACEGIINCSAATIEWLKNQLKLISSAEETAALAASVQDSGGVYLVPAFSGLGAPHWAPDARAAILGMSAFTSREHIVRAALESIAYQIKDALDMLRAGTGVKVRSLHVDGGPTRNAFLMQFTADITRMELKVASIAESSACGAAMNGLLALGLCHSLEDLAALPFESKTYRPRMSPAMAKRLHAGWLDAVQRVLG